MQKNHFIHFVIFIILFVNFAYSQKRIEGYIKGVSFNVCDDTEIKKNTGENESAETKYVVSQFRFSLDSISIKYKKMKPVVPIKLLTLIEAGVTINETHVLKLLENKNYFIVFRDSPWIFTSGISYYKNNGIILGEYLFWTSSEERIYNGIIGFTLGLVYRNQILEINLWLKEKNFEICRTFPDYFVKKGQVYLWKDDRDISFHWFIKEVRGNKEKLPDSVTGFFECCDLIINSLKFE